MWLHKTKNVAGVGGGECRILNGIHNGPRTMSTTANCRGPFRSPIGSFWASWATLLITACFVAAVSSLYYVSGPTGTTDALSLGLEFPDNPANRSWDDHGHADILTSLGWQDHIPSHAFDHPEMHTYGWHPRRIELMELVKFKTIQPGRLEIVQHPEFGSSPVLAKIGDVHEGTWYRLLYDLKVTPHFLGHVIQNGRIVGFLTEYLEGQEEKTAIKRRPSRKEACLTALRRMHARGIVHGDAHGENCLGRRDGSAVLIDFELSVETSSQAEFDRDLWIMSHTVSD